MSTKASKVSKQAKQLIQLRGYGLRTNQAAAFVRPAVFVGNYVEQFKTELPSRSERFLID
ncbi:hypothetical protein HI914_05891 [Erysiphe necator]|nr:hypothetical protein HI914_05891 [Erysiphe necator]